MYIILVTFKHHKLYGINSNAAFAKKYLEYIGHIIFEEVIGSDLARVKSIQEYSMPYTFKKLCNFLCINGFYFKFIRNFLIIAYTLTNLTKEDVFSW